MRRFGFSGDFSRKGVGAEILKYMKCSVEINLFSSCSTESIPYGASN